MAIIKTAEEYTRRMSLADDFMNYSTNDLLYGGMYYLATYHPELRCLYLTAKKYTKNKKELISLTDTNSRQIKAHLDKLIASGLVKEKMFIVSGNGEKELCYTFPYDAKSQYILINNEMLWYIVSTRNKQAVRIYLKLLSWYRYAKEKNIEFIFTCKHLAESIGYSGGNSLAISMVTNILESLKREGVINYDYVTQSFYTDMGKEMTTERKRLLFVADNKSQLKKV